LPLLGWIAFWLVQIQGLLGGLRVVLYKDQLGIVHATLAQLFFVLLCSIALLTSRWWRQLNPKSEIRNPTQIQQQENSKPEFSNSGSASRLDHSVLVSDFGPGISVLKSSFAQCRSSYLFLTATLLILTQLVLGATMRHQHAGLAIPDFPLAYGELWPAMDPDSVMRYNQHRLEVTAVNPITANQIALQMAHRLVAALILCAVALCAWQVRRQPGRRSRLSHLALLWLGLILTQVVLGAATIWSDKAADLATAHVLTGALSLALGAMLSTIWFRVSSYSDAAVQSSAAAAAWSQAPFGPQPSAAGTGHE
jgi:cytochrome c oxidase assembly protein subunit 15